MPAKPDAMTRGTLIGLLNEDLAREYQAIIAYVVYSQTLKGAQYMAIAKELEGHAAQELQHALTIAKQIDYLGGTPTTVPREVQDVAEGRRRCCSSTSTMRMTRSVNYRERISQCEALGEYAIAEEIREILRVRAGTSDRSGHRIEQGSARARAQDAAPERPVMTCPGRQMAKSCPGA